MFPENPTRTKQTVEVYLKRAQTFVKKAREELRLAPGAPLDPRDFAAWLAAKRNTLTNSSWRQYKSAAICLLEQINNDAAFEALDYLRELDGSSCNNKTERTSSQKLKRFPIKDFQKITDYLRNHPGKWHKPLLDWIIGSSLTGLRPHEWVGANLIEFENERALCVINAKHTNGRAHGPDRTLLLGALSDDEFDIINMHSKRAREWDALEQFDDFYKGCSLTLYHVSRKLWPRRLKHVTLYSCRHQFTANAKASGFSTVEIAAMMGHAVDTTATKHYGKKAAGHEMLRVRAIDNDIQNVDAKFEKTLAGLRSKARSIQDPQPKNKPILSASLDPHPEDPGFTKK